MFGAMSFLKKQREEDNRMKKKVLAFLLASTMAIEPFSMASAADFSDGMGQDTVQFSDDAEDVPEVENDDDVDQFGTDAAGADDSTSLTFEEVQSGWVFYDEFYVKGLVNKEASYYVTYVDENTEAPEYSPNHKSLSTNDKAFSTTITVPENHVDVYVFVIDEQGKYISKKLTPNYAERPVEKKYQMGDKVWMTYDDSTRTATISGTGDMWDYLQDGATLDGAENPLINQDMNTLIIGDGITHVSDYLLYKEEGNLFYGHGVQTIQIGKNVKSIGKYAFHCETSLNEVKFMGNDIQELGENCFRMCRGMNNIILPDSINKLGDGCFAECTGLKSVELSNSLKEIPNSCFYRCESLQEINIPDNILNIGACAFQNCTGLKKVVFSINSKIKTIENSAWSNCARLENVDFPNSLEEISSNVFDNCVRLEIINLPDSLTKIGYSAFNGCSRLNNVIIPGSVKILAGRTFSGCSNLSNIVLSEGIERIESGTFTNCIRLQTISIPQSVTNIGYSYDEEENAYYSPFAGCNNLTNIEGYTCSVAKKFYDWFLEKTGKKITFTSKGEGIHQWSNEKETVKEPTCTEKGIKAYRCEICGKTKHEEEIPAYGHKWNNGVTTKKATETEEGEIQYTCWRCNATKTETIPKLSAIKFEYVNFEWNLYDKAYINCRTNKTISYYITTVDKGASAPEYDNTHDAQESSQNGYFGINITMPDEEVDVYIFVADNEDNHTYYKITPDYNSRPQKPSNTVKVGDNITATVEGDTMTLSGEGNTYNEDMYDPDADSIWYQNGINTDNIKHVIFKENNGAITRIGSSLFGGFQNLEDVKFPNGLLEIGDSAFANCNNLKNIDLPEKVRLIEQSAFSGTGISEINWPQNANRIPSGAFAYTNLKKFTVPQNVTEIGEHAFWGCAGLDEITIPESVKYIGSDVFMDCRNLTIYGFRDSTVESYAKANNINFVSVNYKVIFKDNGRTKWTDYVLKGENATPPTLDEKPGYTLSWDADYTNIQEDMVINAVWTKKDNGGGNTTIIVSPSETNKYTVTFKDRGKIVKTEKVKSGDAAEYPYINRNGYELSWDKDFSKVTANITVNAVWTVIKPNKVTSLTAEVQKTSIDLSWDRAENTDYYLVYRKATSDTEYKQIKKTTKILWTDEDVEPGTEYSYKVVGVCSVDGKKYQGADSDVVTAKIGTPQIGDVYSVGDLKYKVTGAKEVSVTGLAKVTDTLTIPSSVTISGKVYKVTAIQDKAFYQNEDIVSIAIGNNVIYIGKYAFYQCPNLEIVKFGKRVLVISTCAFTQCPNLENVTLPSSIRKIGAKAFYQCTSIKVLKINGSVLEYVGKKGLAVNKTVTLRLPKKVYTKYKKLIKVSGVYSKTKFVKF